MSSGNGSLSRRALLRFGASAPFAFVASALYGARTEAQEIDSVCNMVKVCTGMSVDSVKFKNVTEILWRKFREGSGYRRLAPGVFEKAFELTGNFVICNLAGFDDTTYEDIDTSNCCGLCGKKAADKPFWWFSAITPEQFEEAWCETQAEMSAKLARATRIAGRMMAQTTTPGGPGGLGCS